MAIQRVWAEVNGNTYDLTYAENDASYTVQFNAPNKSSFNLPDKKYNVVIKAQDDANNITTIDMTSPEFGEFLGLVVKDIVPPVISLTYPTSDALITNNKPSIQFKITDNDSGVNPESIKITIDNNSPVTAGITKEPIQGGYQCSYTPTNALGEGQHTIKIDAADNDDNAATQATVTFKVDTVPPTLNITNPDEGYVTNVASLTVEGTTNDVTSSPVTVTIKLNSGNAETVSVQSNGAFSKVLTLTEGENTIIITATDAAGKETSITRHVTLDTGGPQFISVSLLPNPADAGATLVLKVKVTDD